MRRSASSRKRRGTALVEAAIVTSVFVTLIFGMIDLGIALFHQHVTSEAARQGARQAIIHGYRAASGTTMNAWGPTPPYLPALAGHSLYAGSTRATVPASDPADELAATIAPYLVGLDPSSVTITIQWPDGNNDIGNRVTVSVRTSYQRPVAFLFGDRPIVIGGSSTMTIMH
jgi:Flp pilus assembly protein TadG